MNKVNQLLRELEIKPLHYEKRGKVTIVITKEKKYVIKKNNHPIYDYLNQRTFTYYPKVRVEGDYEISEYIEEVKIPEEQKLMDMISLVALLHAKTTHYKVVEDYSYQDIYEQILGNLNYLKKQYDEKMDQVESEIFMSPSSYLLARHITSLYNMIEFCRRKVEEWYPKVKELKKIRLVILHNHLELSHFLNNQLISWNKSKIGPPIFDLYQLYQNTYASFDWEDLLAKYLASYPLKEEELELFTILISIPSPIENFPTEYERVQFFQRQLTYMDKTSRFLENIKKGSKLP